MRPLLPFSLLLFTVAGFSQDLQKKLQLEFHGAYYPVDTVQRNFAKTHKIKSITQTQYLYVNGQPSAGKVTQKEEYDSNGYMTNSWRETVQNTFTYDGNNRTASAEIHPKDAFLHDSVLTSRRIMKHDPSGRITETYSSRIDWNTKQLLPYTSVYSYSYDSLGRVYEQKNEELNTTPWVERYVYTTNEVRVYRLDASTDTIDPRHLETVYRFDAKGRLVFEGSPKGKYREYTYDSLGNKIQQRDMSAYLQIIELERQEFGYDAKGRLIKQTIYHKGKLGNEAKHVYANDEQIIATQYKTPTSGYRYKYQYNTNGLKSVLTCEENGKTNWQTKYTYTYYP